MFQLSDEGHQLRERIGCCNNPYCDEFLGFTMHPNQNVSKSGTNTAQLINKKDWRFTMCRGLRFFRLSRSITF